MTFTNKKSFKAVFKSTEDAFVPNSKLCNIFKNKLISNSFVLFA